jgi:hypothetical protein
LSKVYRTIFLEFQYVGNILDSKREIHEDKNRNKEVAMGYVRDLLVAKGSQVWTVSSDDRSKCVELMKRKNSVALVVVDSTGSPKGTYRT